MGRWRFSNRLEADTLKNLSIFKLKQWGYLAGFGSGVFSWDDDFKIKLECITYTDTPCINIEYDLINDANKSQVIVKQIVFLTSTLCHYGGRRYWFICPQFGINGNCGKRVGVLYKVGSYFGCRYCNELTYSSRNYDRKSIHFPVFWYTDAKTRLEKMLGRLKRVQYAGEPTKRYLALCKLRKKMKNTVFSTSGVAIT